MSGIAGHADEAYAQVQEVFEQGADDLGDGGGAFCVYVDGVKVVDLWGGTARPAQPWTAQTRAVLMSATKGLTALCAQLLHDRGLLDVDAPVTEYWPEFGQAGKDKALVRHVLDHTVGVIGLPDAEALLDWQGGGWDQYELIAKKLAAAEPAWEPGTSIGYHAITCGWLTGELVRRITGRTIGTFFHDEVAVPLGLGASIGTPPEQQVHVADVIAESYDGLPEEILALDRANRALFNDPTSPMSQAAIAAHGGNIIGNIVPFMNNPVVRQAEIAAANGTATAASLARVYALLSMGGELDGVRLLDQSSVTKFRAESANGLSAISPPIPLPSGQVAPAPFTSYALGYAYNNAGLGQPPMFGPTPQTYGHAGHGGQIGMCDPARRIAIGFVRSHLTVLPTFAAALLSAVYACVPPE
jgi:CubicO group peptidase (beta-lactamase class C family)